MNISRIPFAGRTRDNTPLDPDGRVKEVGLLYFTAIEFKFFQNMVNFPRIEKTGNDGGIEL